MEVILPADNKKDLADVPENLRSVMQLHFVNTMDEVLGFALERPLPEVADEEAPTIPAIPPAPETVPTAHQ
jgi:ATP-dependent Lon protease